MANQAVVTIDVDDSAFEKFIAKFAEYSARLEEQPETWGKINGEMGAALGNAADKALTLKDGLALAAAQSEIINDQAKKIAESLDKASDGSKDLGKNSDKSEKSFSKLQQGAKNLGGSIVGAGKSLLKAFGPAAIAGLGLGGILSGFGINELTSAAFQRSKTAAGYGVTTGQLAGFKLAGQTIFGSPETAIANAAAAQTDLAQAANLAILGINQQVAARLPATELAFKELQAAAQAYRKAPPGTQQQQVAVIAYQALGGSLEDVRRAASLSAAELEKVHEQAQSAARGLELTGNAAKNMTALKLAFDKLGITIESRLINALGDKFAPALDRVVGGIESVVDAFISSNGFKYAIEAISNGLDNLATWIGKQNWQEIFDNVEAAFARVIDFFTKDIPWQTIGETVVTFGAELKKVVDFLAPIFGIKPSEEHGAKTDQDKYFPSAINKKENEADFEASVKQYGSKLFQQKLAGAYNPKNISDLNAAASAKFGVPKEVLDRLTEVESSYGQAQSLVSSAGAVGITQWLPSSAKQPGYGIAPFDPSDPKQATAATAQYLVALKKQFGSWKLALAAYNEGPGNLEAQLRSGKPLPKDVQDYVSRIVGPKSKNTDIDIEQILGTAFGKSPNITVPTSTPSPTKSTVSYTPMPSNQKSVAMRPVQVSIYNATGGGVWTSINAAAGGASLA